MVPFPITTPSDPSPSTVFVSPNSTLKVLPQVVFVVRDSGMGTYWVIQGLPDIADAARREEGWKTRVAQNGDPGWNSTAELVRLANGTNALLGTDQGGIGSIEFVVDGVQFNIIGERISPEQAANIANDLAIAAAQGATT